MVIEGTWWPVLREAVDARYAGQEWPVEAMAADLAWERAEEAAGRSRVPGRPTLRARWRTTEFRVRVLLAGATPPADRQPTASAPPAATTANADNRSEIASRPPADRQRTASGAVSDEVPTLPPPTPPPIPDQNSLLERSKDQGGAGGQSPDEAWPETAHPAAVAFLRLIRRWSTTDDDDARRLTADQRWKVKPAADLNWFLTDLMLSPEAQGLDLVTALSTWGDWVEVQARRLASKQASKFPRNWKSALRHGLKFAQQRQAGAGGIHGTGSGRGAFSGAQQRFQGIRQEDGRGSADDGDWRRDWK